MSLHKEISFESEICEHLASHGWLYQSAPACRLPAGQAGQTGLAGAEHPQGVGRGCKDAEASTTTHGDAAGYDRARALFPADVLAWVQATQPQAWEILTKNHGAQAGETLLNRLRDQLYQRGTLDVLRHGIELLGLKAPLKLAEFKPVLAINPDILARHAANRLRVVRQLRYSLHNENSLDLGLFLNGLQSAPKSSLSRQTC